MFDFLFDGLFLKCFVNFRSDVTWHTPSYKVHFCLVNQQNNFPKVLGLNKMLFGKRETGLYVIFGQQRFWPRMPFLPSLSFLLLDLECWTLNGG